MQVRVLHFGPLRERRGCAEETVTVDGPVTLVDLYDQLFPQPRPPVAYVRNAERVSGSTAVADGDELTFLPPLGGG